MAGFGIRCVEPTGHSVTLRLHLALTKYWVLISRLALNSSETTNILGNEAGLCGLETWSLFS
jgi:hypothetical protein